METVYKGRKMRSQLEARWAAFFDKAGWEYDYEPALDLNGWLPDFILYSDEYLDEDGNNERHKILVEVKPNATVGAFNETLPKILKAIKNTEWESSEILLLGSSVFKSKFLKEFDDFPAKGLLGWFYQINSQRIYKDGKPQWDRKRITCEAYAIEIYGENSTYDLTDGDMFSRLQGYWDHNYGASYSFDWSYHMDYNELKNLWDEAGNEVQWRKSENNKP